MFEKIKNYFITLSEKNDDNKMCGVVKKGFGRDSQRGFPTANVDLPLDHGIYLAEWRGKTTFLFKGIRGDKRTLCHIMGFEGDLYEKTICFTNVKKIPDIMLCHGFYTPCKFKFE